MYRVRSLPSGATLVELLISAGLLGLLTALFFGAVLPTMKRSDWFLNSQDHLRNFISARQLLNQRLRKAKLIAPADISDPGDNNLHLEYQRPRESSTNLGEMIVIDLGETTIWADQVFQLVQRNHDLMETDQSGSVHRMVWALEDDDQVSVVVEDDLRGVRFTLSGIAQTKNSDFSGTRWTYDFRVKVE